MEYALPINIMTHAPVMLSPVPPTPGVMTMPSKDPAFNSLTASSRVVVFEPKILLPARTPTLRPILLQTFSLAKDIGGDTATAIVTK
jgi:hypothetical protein